jgi:serine/threonine protein kinase
LAHGAGVVTSAIERYGMTPERYQQIGELFDAALERPGDERSAWLEKASGGDAELCREVENLLANHVASGTFLGRPAMEIAAELLVQNPPAKPDVLGRQISHYQILSLLGAGGMGHVYLAKDTRLGRPVALKLLPPRYLENANHIRRFEREALAASALNHPNILTIYEFGAEGDAHFLATEFVQGETLRQRSKRGALSIAEVLDLVGQITAALQAAHEAGIIHRDIKPENVMLRKDGIVKVLDFGLAKLVETQNAERGARNAEEKNGSEVYRSAFQDHSSTLPGTVMGTVAYMSPEQARGLPVDARTDLFSLGVLLYELLAGRQPFTGQTVNHTIVAILEADPPPLTVAGRMIPAELERILKRLLAKQPDHRYATAGEVLAELKQLTKRLEREQELILPVTDDGLPTQVLHLKTTEQLGGTTLQLPPDDFHASNAATFLKEPGIVAPQGQDRAMESLPLLTKGDGSQKIAHVTVAPTPRKFVWGLGVLLVAALIGVPAGQWLLQRSVNSIIAPTASLPERSLSYFLTVQRYRNGKPYQAELQSSGREIFEAGWQFKLNVNSSQDGFLYLLNEEPGGAYVLLFPLPSHNNGSARLTANERFQTSPYLFDDKPGTEQFRLIWAAQPVPELESLRALVNPTDKGRISDSAQQQTVRAFLQQHANSLSDSIRDSQNKQTIVRGTGAVLVALIELEHQ